MPIPGIEQPEILPIDDTFRLRTFDDRFDFAFDWYQDTETVWLVDGVKKPYSRDTLGNMYHYLEKRGELYFIETMEDGRFRPVGDVCFWKDDLPIVIGERRYRGRGIGRKVIAALIRRGKELGYSRLYVREIYDYNVGSRKCFEGPGFRAWEKKTNGNRFILDLERSAL